MKTKHKERYSELKGRDNYGKFTIRVQKDFSQFSLETANGDAYIDVNKSELEGIRDFISELLIDKSTKLIR